MSQYKVKDTVLKKILELLFEVVGKQNNKDVFLSVTFDVLSSTEQLMIAKRIATMYLLLKNIDYVVIGDILKISTASIAKYKLLVERSEGIRKVLVAVIKHDKERLFIRDLFASIYPPGSYGTNWKVAHKIQKAIEREKKQGM